MNVFAFVDAIHYASLFFGAIVAPPFKDEDTKQSAPAQSFRFVDRAQFALELLANQTASKKTRVLEDSIFAAADKLGMSKHWQELYDLDPGVRTLNLFACRDYRASNKEQPTRLFVNQFRDFFYSQKHAHIPRRDYVTVLWPHIDELRKLWEETKSTDYQAVVKQMTKLLKAAKLSPPVSG